MRVWHIYYGPWNWHERNLYLPQEMVAVWKEAGHRANAVNTDLVSLVGKLWKLLIVWIWTSLGAPSFVC
jgi:hypothetical protein